MNLPQTMKNSTSLILVLLIKITSEQPLLAPVDSNTPKLTKLMQWTATENSPSCSSVILHDGSQTFSQKFEAVIKSHNSILMSTYVITFTPSTSPLLLKNLQVYDHHTFFGELGSMSKLKPSCSLAVLLLKNDKSNNLLTDFLTPKNFEILKRDHDQFIFVTIPSISERILTSNFASKIKFKISVAAEVNHVAINTISFYGNNGRPKFMLLARLKWTDIGRTKPASVLNMFPDMTKNLNGFQLIVANSEKTFQRGEMMLQNGKYEPVTGLYFLVLYKVLKPRYNFTVKLIPSFGDGGTGLQLPNGTWLGSLADVAMGNAHLGMTMCQSVTRTRVIDFTFAVTYEWITFTTGRPKGVYSWRAVYKPFEETAWAFVFVSFVITSLIATILIKFLTSQWEVSRILHYMIASLLEQNCKVKKIQILRFLLASWLIFSLIVRTAYRSTAFGFMVSPAVEPPPKNFKQLAVSDEYSWGLNFLSGTAYSIFAYSQDLTYKKIYSRMELVNDTYDCYHRAATTKFACISWRSFADHLRVENFTDREGRSELVTANVYNFFVPCGWGLEKRAIFKDNFDRALHMGHDAGLVNKWEEMDEYNVKKRKWDWEQAVNKTVGDIPVPYDQPQGLKIHNLFGGIYFWGLFLAVAVGIFLFEVIMSV